MFKKQDTLISLSFAPLLLPVAWCIVSVLHFSSSFTVFASFPVFTSVFSAFTYRPVSGPGSPHIYQLQQCSKGHVEWNDLCNAPVVACPVATF